MTIRYAALVMAALAALTGCTSVDTDGGLRPDSNAGRTVLAHTDIRPGPRGEMFFEGAVPEIRLVDGAGKVNRPVRDHRETAAFPALEPGIYRIQAALRPCDGNCGTLDGAMYRCSAQVRVDGAEVLRVRWRVGQTCRVGGA
jgi:hypothetical protein